MIPFLLFRNKRRLGWGEGGKAAGKPGRAGKAGGGALGPAAGGPGGAVQGGADQAGGPGGGVNRGTLYRWTKVDANFRGCRAAAKKQ